MRRYRRMEKACIETEDSGWRGLCKIGGTAALMAVVVVLAEMLITFLPGGSASPETVVDWFTLLQSNWFLGLRNLGLLNLFFTILGIPVFLALYAAHRQANGACAALAMIVSFVGLAVFLATNRAFPMLALSRQYAAATDAQRAALMAAGWALLAVGESHTAGTFLGFFLSEVAGIIMSVVMWRGRAFSSANACAGILGFILLLIFEIFSSFVPGSFDLAMLVAMVGGLLNITWYILTARRLLQLGQDPSRK
jgi:hypothetical protein